MLIAPRHDLRRQIVDLMIGKLNTRLLQRIAHAIRQLAAAGIVQIAAYRSPDDRTFSPAYRGRSGGFSPASRSSAPSVPISTSLELILEGLHAGRIGQSFGKSGANLFNRRRRGKTHRHQHAAFEFNAIARTAMQIRLTIPATDSTKEAMMNGHLYRRKSKFVCLNNSIDHCPPVTGPNRATPYDTG